MPHRFKIAKKLSEVLAETKFLTKHKLELERKMIGQVIVSKEIIKNTELPINIHYMEK